MELANATVFSSILAETVELPMEGAAWERQLNQLIAESKTDKKNIKASKISADDFVSSFRK